VQEFAQAVAARSGRSVKGGLLKFAGIAPQYGLFLRQGCGEGAVSGGLFSQSQFCFK